eukprot:6492191-Prymnesium_polylepis.1
MVLIHTGCELAATHGLTREQNATAAAYWSSVYSRWRRVLRHYWSDYFAEAAIAEWVPLGWFVPMDPFILERCGPAAHVVRDSFVGFYGNSGNNRGRAEMIRHFERATGYRVTGGAVDAPFAHGSPSWYRERMSRTSLCLQLPGLSPETFRLYEALEAGCVPVVIVEYSPGIEVQLRPLLGGDAAPFLHTARAADLASRLATLSRDDAALGRLRTAVVDWWCARRSAFRSRVVQALAGG